MIIAGTGHRPDKLGGYSKDTSDKVWTLAHNFLQDYKDKIEEVIVGGALGWDTELASASLYLKIPVCLAIPFVGQEKKWYQSDQERYWMLYHKILEQGGRVKVISKDGYSVEKMQIRNKWMVDNADVIIALWNGSSGGTANCVKYAEKNLKKVVNLWDKLELGL